MAKCSSKDIDLQYVEQEHNRLYDECISKYTMTRLTHVSSVTQNMKGTEIAVHVISQHSNLILFRDVAYYYFENEKTIIVFHK